MLLIPLANPGLRNVGMEGTDTEQEVSECHGPLKTACHMIPLQTPLNSQRMHDPDLERQLEEHHGSAFGWALSCCGWDRATAQVFLQTAYLKVLRGRAKFAGR